MLKPDMVSIIHIKNQWNILVIGNYYVNYQNYQNLMHVTSSDTKRTLMHLLLFTNSAQRELVLICTQSIHDRNWLSLPYILDTNYSYDSYSNVGKLIFIFLLYYIQKNVKHRNKFKFLIQGVPRNMTVGE